MSVIDQALKCTGVSEEELCERLSPVKINANRNSRKANLKRTKNFTARKIYATSSSFGEVGAKTAAESKGRKADKKKFRNDLESCLILRSKSFTSDEDLQKGDFKGVTRTCSMSPIPSTPLLNAELPLRKFYTYMTKIAEQFEIVKLFANSQIEEGDSLQEMNRLRKRANEFAIRFSRNNLYQMKRLVNDIKKILVPYPFENLAKSDSEVLCRKILLAYQSATQSLQTYINYMKSGQSLDVPEKSRELVLLILDLYLCCEHVSLPVEQTDFLATCKELIILLDMKIAEKRKSPGLRPGERLRESQKEEKRFSMYRTKLTTSNWKKKSEALAKIKFGGPKLSHLKKIKKREERNALPKSTLEIYSQRVQDATYRKASKSEIDIAGRQVTDRIPAKKLHATPRAVTSQDNDIETVVQNIDNDESLVAHYAPMSETDSGPDGRNTDTVRDLFAQTIQEIQHGDRGEIEQTLNNLLKSLTCRSRLPPPPPLPPPLPPHRNVKLIHVVSPDPIPEEPEAEKREEEEVEKLQQEAANKNPDKHRKNLFQPIQGGDQPENVIEIRMPEEERNLAMKYKKSLIEYRKNNIMYRKGISVKPCEMMMRISDKIIEELLLEISSGMEDENLINQLYHNELLDTV